MSSKILDIIEEIEEYIEGCKPQAWSNGSRIIVNKEGLEELLTELRLKTPEEVKRYQKIISNKEAILADAKAKAEEIIAQAQVQTTELISEHEIMQQAYAQANEVVMIATKQAQEILDNATNDANDIRMGAMTYTDGMLKAAEDIIIRSMETYKAHNENFTRSMQGYLDIIAANRAELLPPDLMTEEEAETSEANESAEPIDSPVQE